MTAVRQVWAVLASAVYCASSLTACSAEVPPYREVAASPAPPPAEAADPRCPRDGAGLGAGDLRDGAGPVPGSLPSSFTPSRVCRCRIVAGPAQVPGGGGLRITVSEETSADGTPLLGALTRGLAEPYVQTGHQPGPRARRHVQVDHIGAGAVRLRTRPLVAAVEP